MPSTQSELPLRVPAAGVFDKDFIADIDAEVGALTLAHFDLDDAWWLGQRARQIGLREKTPVAIVVDGVNGCLFSTLLPGATQDNLHWIRRKFAVVRRFERCSLAVGLMFRGQPELNERFGLNKQDYALSGGAIPIRVQGAGMVGIIGVSGVPQEVDHAIAFRALSDLKDHQAMEGNATK
jgi:uncharacterized protein (UPF0303 family)